VAPSWSLWVQASGGDTRAFLRADHANDLSQSTAGTFVGLPIPDPRQEWFTGDPGNGPSRRGPGVVSTGLEIGNRPDRRSIWSQSARRAIRAVGRRGLIFLQGERVRRRYRGGQTIGYRLLGK
jgi:hypothetical protein